MHPQPKSIKNRAFHSQIQRLSSSADIPTRQWVQKYLGTNKPTKCIKSAVIHQYAQKHLHELKNSSEFFNLIDQIYGQATTFEEMSLAATLFTKGSKFHDSTEISWLNKWLNKTVGWAEVDGLCQSSIDAISMIRSWNEWYKQLTRFSLDENIHKRRASIVLLCRPLRESSDSRISDMAFELVDRLKGEKEVLITKAISWVLRSTVKHHPDELAIYLEKNRDTLPRVAYREASKKLTTGRKS